MVFKSVIIINKKRILFALFVFVCVIVILSIRNGSPPPIGAKEYFPNRVNPRPLDDRFGESGRQNLSNGASQKLIDTQGAPTLDQELVRHRLHSNILEMWYYLRNKIKDSSQLEFVNQLRNTLLTDLNILTRPDENWRRDQLRKLGNYVQKMITELQNPKNCSSAKKLICNLNLPICGFACEIHHVTYCLVTALATQRTLIINAENWGYANGFQGNDDESSSAWNSVFQPLSETCIAEEGSSRTSWEHQVDLEEFQVVDMPILATLKFRPSFLPLSIPRQFKGELSRLHGAPIAWFLGQILRYILRPSQEMQNYIIEHMKKLKFRHPIVGVHVRRTDKLEREAKFHSLSEYMMQVEDYYKFLDQQNEQLHEGNGSWRVERLVYLATDDHIVWSNEVPEWEARGYTFIGDSSIAQTADPGRRYAFDSLKNIMLDIILLSQCDCLVCTMSSNICRMSYELMQTRLNSSKMYPGTQFHMEPVDRSKQFYSLDDIYFFSEQDDHKQIAIQSHKADGTKSPGDIDIERGDLLRIQVNQWDGYSRGLNLRTRQFGRYPSFKVKQKIDSAYFKAFDDFDVKDLLGN